MTSRRLLGFLRPYRTQVIVSVLLAIGSQAATLTVPYLTGQVIEVTQEAAHDRRSLYLYSGLIVVAAVVTAILTLFRRWLAGRVSLAVEYDLRNTMYRHMQRLSYAFYDTHQTGQLMSRATVDLQAVRFFLGYGLIFLSQNVVTITIVIGALFVIDWQLALIALAISPVLAYVAYRYSRRSHPVLRDVQQKIADVTTQAEENVIGVRVVKAFAQEPRQRERFGQAAESVFRRAIRPHPGDVPAGDVVAALGRDRRRAAGRRLPGHPRPADAGRLLRRQRLPADAGTAAAHIRPAGGPVPAGDGLRRSDLRGARLRA